MNENDAKTIEQELSVLERIQLIGKVGTASLPLTYVSGYLICTSYLGTYGLHISASDLFRAKYIYIGFEYLMFLALVIAVFRVGMRIVELFLMSRRDTSPGAQNLHSAERRLAFAVLRGRSDTIEHQTRRRFSDFRGDLVVGLVVLVFTLEIMFVNPENLGGILPYQILFLAGVAIYQSTFYRELHEPFAWGLVYGRRYIEDVRWLLLNAQAAAATSLIAHVIVNAMRNAHITGASFWTVYVVGWVSMVTALEIEVVCIIGASASKDRLIQIDKDERFDPVKWEAELNVGKEIGSSIQTFRALRGAWSGYFMPCGSRHPNLFILWRAIYLLGTLWLWSRGFFSHPGFWANTVLVFGPLILSLLVLSNVGLLTALFARRAKRLGYRVEEIQSAGSANGPDGDLGWREAAKDDQHTAKIERYARRAILVAVLYVTSVLSFGYVVYPHIPVQKEGGNYVTADRVCVHLVKDAPELQCPSSLVPSLKGNEALVPLEEDSDWVYLANDHDARGPHCWSWAGMEDTYCRPRVYAVNRRCIAGITDALSEASADRCSSDQNGKDEMSGATISSHIR